MRNKLKALRIEHGYTQTELADAIKVSPQTISNWESGTKDPRLSNVIKLSEILNENISQIFLALNTTKVNKRDE